MPHEHHPLAGRAVSVRKAGLLSVRPATDTARFSLRIDPAGLAEASTAFGLDLPARIGAVAAAGGKIAVRLGPDEWYLMAPPAGQAAVEDAFAAFYARLPHSLVDIGHREVGIEIEGAGAVLALQSALPFDVEAMPVGSGCRTLFDKAQIVLLREAQDRFRIEVWRTFATHVWGLLEAASREVELDI